MGILSRAADLVYTLRFLKLLVTPFEKTEAFKLNIIDKDGNRIKETKLDTPSKKSAYSTFHRLVYNIRRLMSKVPGGKSTLANYAAALFLIHEKYGIDIDKVITELNITKSDLYEESHEWFLLDSGMLSPGTYRVKNAKMLNSSCEELVRPRDQIRIPDNCYPKGKVGSIFVYEAIHLNTGQPIYVTTNELLR